MAFNRCFPRPGDLELTSGGRDIELVSGSAKVLQSIQSSAQIFKGSWRYDRAAGVPYFQEILGFGTGTELIRRRFHEMLINKDGVASVVNLTTRQDSGTLYVDFEVVAFGETVNGTLDFQAVES